MRWDTWNEAVVSHLKAMSQHLPNRTVENHNSTQLGQPVSWLILQPGKSKIQSLLCLSAKSIWISHEEEMRVPWKISLCSPVGPTLSIIDIKSYFCHDNILECSYTLINFLQKLSLFTSLHPTFVTKVSWLSIHQSQKMFHKTVLRVVWWCCNTNFNL